MVLFSTLLLLLLLLVVPLLQPLLVTTDEDVVLGEMGHANTGEGVTAGALDDLETRVGVVVTAAVLFESLLWL